MKRLLILFSLFLSMNIFSQVLNEIEPNGCITLVGGSDSYQTLYPSFTLIGSISLEDSEGCLYFDYGSEGKEFIEDLYALDIQAEGYYLVTLSFGSNVDLDFYIMDENLNVLNPQECGSFYCGLTCGNPEFMNIYLKPQKYIIGVSIPTTYYCFEPKDSQYILTVSSAKQPTNRPIVTSLAKASNPFRLYLFGYSLSTVKNVYINGYEWKDFKITSTGTLKLLKGSALKSKFPKDGSWVPITIVNGSGQSFTLLYNRAENIWREGGY